MVLLAKRSAGRKAYPGCWSFPGGHVEEGETLSDALARELQEEVGLTPRVYKRIDSISEPNSETDGRVIYHMFAVFAWDGGEPCAAGDEHSEIRWFTIEEACAVKRLALPEYGGILRKLGMIELSHSN